MGVRIRGPILSLAARPRVFLIHAVTVAMEPIQRAFASGWPEAETVNLLDDSLAVDRARDAQLTPALHARFEALARYAEDAGADAILFTCSAFGAAIEAAAAKRAIPVLKPNEAMFEAAVLHGQSLGMLATFQPAVATMEEEFAELAARRVPPPRLTTRVVPAAMQALRAGDAEAHNRLIAEQAAELAGCDAVMLAHFSTSRALAAVQARLRVPVLTAPDAAVAKLRALVSGAGR